MPQISATTELAWTIRSGESWATITPRPAAEAASRISCPKLSVPSIGWAPPSPLPIVRTSEGRSPGLRLAIVGSRRTVRGQEEGGRAGQNAGGAGSHHLVDGGRVGGGAAQGTGHFGGGSAGP